MAPRRFREKATIHSHFVVVAILLPIVFSCSTKESGGVICLEAANLPHDPKKVKHGLHSQNLFGLIRTKKGERDFTSQDRAETDAEGRYHGWPNHQRP